MENTLDNTPYLNPSQYTADINALQEVLDVAWDDLSNKQRKDIIAILSSYNVKFE